jgi:hypothetical protein
MQAWTQSFREQLVDVDQITQRMCTVPNPVAFYEAGIARTPSPIVCTGEMHSAISTYYEALDAFLVSLHRLSGDAVRGALASDGSAGRADPRALTRLADSIRALDSHLGTLPSPSWRPSMTCMGVSALAGGAGLAGAVALPSMSDDPRRPSDVSMVLRVMISFLGFIPFFVLSARRAYLDDSDSEAFRKLKVQIADVQSELARFAEMAGIEIAGMEVAGTEAPSS